MKHPIPDVALDDRLAFIGASGSGKTYAAGGAVERALGLRHRVVVLDPLGVWWGLRLGADGGRGGFPVVIFGGAHGDLPLTETAGALIGETVAGMAESAIVDLSAIGTKAGERRFVLAFLTQLYRRTTGAPLLVVFDEADMWAPQQIRDRDGDAARLLGMMETIVRRGRVKGFTPWLITQRPAVLNKDVLSQVDGLVAMKLSSPHDRAALKSWVEGAGDPADLKALNAQLPAMPKGSGVVWIPGRDIFENARFPVKATFDSSAAPKRGEKGQAGVLAPLDIGALKSRMAEVQAEAQANDPVALRKRIAALEKAAGVAVDKAAIAEAEARGEARGRADEVAKTRRDVIKVVKLLGDLKTARISDIAAKIDEMAEILSTGLGRQGEAMPTKSGPPPKEPHSAAGARVKHSPDSPVGGGSSLSRPSLKVLEALSFWNDLGFTSPSREQVGVVAGYSPSSGGFGNLLGKLRSDGLIDYPRPGEISLTDAGAAVAPESDKGSSVLDRLANVLSRPQMAVLSALPEGATLSKSEVAEAAGYSATSGGFGNLLGSLRTLKIIDYPSPGHVAAEGWVFR